MANYRTKKPAMLQMYHRHQGQITFSEIARSLNVSRQAVHTALTKEGIKGTYRPPPKTHPCAWCGKQLLNSRYRKYCGEDCRHADFAKQFGSCRFVEPELECTGCGETFKKSKLVVVVLDNNGRQNPFCSLKCFLSNRIR